MKYGIIKDDKENEVVFSRLILGTALFGSTIPLENAFELLDTYYEHGGRVIDTARVYSDWLPNGHNASEKTVGMWLKERGIREKIILVTKGAHPPMDHMHSSRMTPEHIFFDLQESLKFLQTDYVDVYFLHRDDETVPVNIIMDALDIQVKAGRIRMLGASNWRMERILEANAYACTNGKTPFTISEIQWSYAECTKETLGDDTVVCMDKQQYELYKENKIPVMAFTSQANGVFSCGYKEDLSDIEKKHERYYSEENIKRYKKLLELCRETGDSPTKVALNYIIDNNDIEGFAIIGCSKVCQLLDSLAAVED